MGWGRMMLLGNIGQQLDIQDTQEALRSLDQRLRAAGKFDQETSDYLHTQHREFSELRLHYAALIELLLNKGLVNREELLQLVDKIDRADGKADQKHNGSLIPPA